MRIAFVAVLIGACSPGPGAAQEAVRLVESFHANYQYRVSCRVVIEGSLQLPPAKGQPPQTLKIAGKSVIDYHERVLNVAGGKVDKSVRKVHQMEFMRTVAGDEQESKLRPDVSLLVIQRLNNLEVPFSPQGPLLIGEIDLVRTDVFTPALAGLLPPTPVKVGDEWPASPEAVQELTDLEKVKKGGLTCRYEGLEPANLRQARVSFKGVLNGIGEDGAAEHDLEGYLFFDVQTNHVGYLSLQGIHRPLSPEGLPQGEIKGTFTLAREPGAKLEALGDAALARWNLVPNDDNTLLLFENADGRFLYPRHWRVEEAGGRQIRVVEKQGSEALITFEALAKLPTAAAFQKEVLAGLSKQAKIANSTPVRTLQNNPFTIEHFGLEARFETQTTVFDHFVVRQNGGGATLAARYASSHADARRREVERLARSILVNVK